MSVHVLLSLLGPEEIRRYSEDQLDELSEALIQAIDSNPPTRARLMTAVEDAIAELPVSTRS